ncbi:MAG: PorV/PorQ family protein [Chlorobi bacterium]|nr:PorV/PorQ family protein [Chlorobiota bacterium]
MVKRISFKAYRWLIIPLLLLVVTSLQAQRNAKYAGEFLSLGVGARYSGLGGAGVAISNDVTAGYFNPSNLSTLKFPQISVFHEPRFAGLFNYDYAAGALPIDEKQTAGLTILRFGYGEIKDTRNALIDRNGNGIIDEEDRVDPNRIRIGSAADWAFVGSYARAINKKLSVGGNVKLLYRAILATSAWGFGIDIGASYKARDHLTLGVTLYDATKSLLAWETGHQEFIVPSLRLGAAYNLDITDDHSVRPTLDGIYRFEGREEATTVDAGLFSLDIAAGIEYGYKNKVFARGGYSELGQLSLGAGVKLPKLNIDYSFTQENGNLDNIGVTHRVSLMLTLEEDKFLRGS